MPKAIYECRLTSITTLLFCCCCCWELGRGVYFSKVEKQGQDFCGALQNWMMTVGFMFFKYYIIIAAAQPPIIFQSLFQSPCHFQSCLPRVSIFLMSEMALKSYTPLWQPWSFISSQASKVLLLLFSNIEGREFAPWDSLLIAIRFLVIAIALQRKIHTTWATLQFSVIVLQLFIEIQWGSKQCHLSHSCLT